jgi:SRSO17 transposase
LASNGVRVSGHRLKEERMEAAVALEVPAVEVRDRLIGFVEEVAGRLPLRRQRENALLYVRGLVEHGGRKSLQPTLFRLEETPARYESVQQFLADSPWQPGLLIRACAERVAPQVGVVAWIVDDTGIVKDGKHSPGVKRQYSGTLGKIGNCQITISVHAVGERGTLPLGLRLYLPEEWCDDLARRRKAKIPDGVVFETKPQLAGDLCEQAAGWRVPTAPILADSAYGDDAAFRTRLAELELEYVVAVRAETSVYGPETSFAVPERTGSVGRPRTVARADRKPETVLTLAKRLPAKAWPDAALPDNTRGRGRLEPFCLRPRRRHQSRPKPASAGAVGVASHRVAQGRGGAERLLALQPRRGHVAQAPRPARQAALDGRARLPTAQGRTRARPLRRAKLPWLPPPHRARHLRARLPHRGAPAPESPAAGLTLPQAVLLLQPVLRCWAGRCRTCNQVSEAPGGRRLLPIELGGACWR